MPVVVQSSTKQQTHQLRTGSRASNPGRRGFGALRLSNAPDQVMPSLVLGRFFLRLVPRVDVFLMIAALNAVDHEIKRVTGCYVYAMLPAIW
jgi:hypothetical protein